MVNFFEHFDIFLESNNDPAINTCVDSYGTLKNFYHSWGIKYIPTRKEFYSLYKRSPVVSISPEEITKLTNTSAFQEMIGKGLKDKSIIDGTGIEDQRHDSWRSILYHAKNINKFPIVIVVNKGKKILLDGDHRAVAGVLTNTPIMARIINLDNKQDD